jgi:hypothetical protein
LVLGCQFSFSEEDLLRAGSDASQADAGGADTDAGADAQADGPPVVDDTQWQLTVRVTGNGPGRVVSSPAGIDCPGTCQASFTTESVTLQSTTERGVFQGWVGTGCFNSEECRISMSQEEIVEARFIADRNIIFISEGTLMAGKTTVSEADLLCKNEAAAAGLPGFYVAWMAGDGASATERLNGARGFIRPDGLPVTNDLDLDAVYYEPLYYPVVLTAAGERTAEKYVLSAPSWGDSWASNCDNFNNPDATLEAGIVGAVTYHLSWGTDDIYMCDQRLPVYCVGTDHTNEVTPLVHTGRKVFVSSAMYGNFGLAGADAQCAADAAAVPGMTGTYSAFVATPTSSAASRFDLDGVSWVTTTGLQVFADAADVVTRAPETGIFYTADGEPSDYLQVWTGSVATNEVLGPNCVGWRSDYGSEYGVVGAAHKTDEFFFAETRSCDYDLPVYCVEN